MMWTAHWNCLTIHRHNRHGMGENISVWPTFKSYSRFFFQSFSNCSVGSQFCGFSWCFPAVEFIIYFGQYLLCCLWQVRVKGQWSSTKHVFVLENGMKLKDCTWRDIRLSLTDSLSGDYRLAAGIGCRLGHSHQILSSAYSFVQEFYLHLQC